MNKVTYIEVITTDASVQVFNTSLDMFFENRNAVFGKIQIENRLYHFLVGFVLWSRRCYQSLTQKTLEKFVDVVFVTKLRRGQNFLEKILLVVALAISLSVPRRVADL
jgi:hypothetical protein